MPRTTTGFPDDDDIDSEKLNRLVGEAEIRAFREGDGWLLEAEGAGDEPNPPQRPGHAQVQTMLVVGAMVVLGTFLLVAVCTIEEIEGTSWLTRFVSSYTQLFIYGLPGAALVLLALSLVVRSRRR